MRIVALDTHVISFDGLSWEAFAKLGDLESYERSQPGDIVPRSIGAEALVVNKAVIDRVVMAALPSLVYIGITATGTNNVDLAEATTRGIAVSNVPGYGADSVAQGVFSYLLHRAFPLTEYARMVREGAWSTAPDFCLPGLPQRELAGATLGIVGYGAIGKRVAELGRAFGMEVLVAAVPGRTYAEPRHPLDRVLAESDFVSLHCPLTPHTANLVNDDTLALMKKTAVLVNTARGGLVDERALRRALEEGVIGGAFLDVLTIEPPPADHPLLGAPNLVITPHVTWATREARSRLLEQSAENLAAFLRGETRNRVA